MGVYLIVVGIVVAAFDIALSTLLSIYLHTDYSNKEVMFLPDCLPGEKQIKVICKYSKMDFIIFLQVTMKYSFLLHCCCY